MVQSFDATVYEDESELILLGSGITIRIENDLKPIDDIYEIIDGKLVIDITETNAEHVIPEDIDNSTLVADNVLVEYVVADDQMFIIGEYEDPPMFSFPVVSKSDEVVYMLHRILDPMADEYVDVEVSEDDFLVERIQEGNTYKVPVNKDTMYTGIEKGELIPSLHVTD